MADATDPLPRRRFVTMRPTHAILLLLICAAVYWLGLGATPFASSEGHRVVPGWTMLDTGDWMHVEMFGLTYFRKPPGLPWAIAISSAAFGQSEFAARAPSALCATLMAFAAYAFALRWFGDRGPGPALGAGLAQALTPLFWSPGHTAEIEALNNLGTQFVLLATVDLMVHAWPQLERSIAGRRPFSAGMAVVAALGILVAALAKGPASTPFVVGVLLAGVIAARSLRVLFSLWLWLGPVLAAAVLIPVGLAILRANSDADAVTQGVSDFMKWSSGRVIDHLGLIPIALVSALPTSLAMLFPWGSDARAEAASGDAGWLRAYRAARILAIGWFCGAAICFLIGLDNARYLMPAAVLLPPLVGYVLRGRAACPPPFTVAGFTDSRKQIARTLLCGKPPAWVVMLTVAAVLGTVAPRLQKKQPMKSPRAGALLAEALPDGSILWADDLIEARPDLLLYTERAAADAGKRVEVLWAKPRMLAGILPPPGAFIALRTDAGSDESKKYQAAALGEHPALRPVYSGKLAEFEFFVFQATDAPRN